MTSFAEAFVRLHVDQKALRADTEKALQGTNVSGAGAKAGQSWAKGFGSKAVHVSNVITGAMAGGAVAVGAASVKMAIGFQEAMTTLSTGAGVAEKDLRVIGDGIKKISVQTGTTTDELIKGEFMIASAGFTGASSLKILRAAAEGAKTGNADLATVTDAVTTAMKDYHVGAGGATKITSQLVAVVSHGKTHLTDLATSLSKILPTASSLGLGLDQVGGAMATMTGEGVTARLAATHLNVALLAMAAPNKAAASAMGDLGLKSSHLSDTLTKKGLIAALDLVRRAALKAGPEGSPAYVAAMKAMMGGSAGLAVALQLTGKHAVDLAKNTAAVGAATGDAKGRVQGFALVQKDAAFKLSQFSAEGKVAAINIGEKLLPALTATMSFVSGHTGLVLGLAGAIGGLAVSVSAGTKAYKAYAVIQALATKAALGTRIQLGLLKISTLAQAAASKIAAAGQWLLNIALDANPVGIVIAAIVALIAIFVVLWVKCKWFRDFWKGLWHDLTNWAVDAWHFVEKAALTVFGAIIDGAAKMFGWLPFGIGDDLKKAAAKFDEFRNKVNASMGGIHDRKVALKFSLNLPPGVSYPSRPIKGRAAGWRVPGYGGGDIWPALLEGGEAVVPKHLVPAIAPFLRAHGVPGFAAGSLVGTGVSLSLPALTGLTAAFNMYATKLASQVALVLEKHLPLIGGGFTGGSGVTRWAPVILAALRMLGQSSSWLGLVERRMNQESGGNPYAINRWDSNWLAGTPSVGLMQVIGPTYAAYAGPFRNVGPFAYGTSEAPLANIYAGLNYALHRYGTLAALGQPGGYKHGGWLSEAIAGVGMQTGRGYMFHGGEGVTTESGLADLRGLLAELISAVHENAYATAGGVAEAIGGAAHMAGVRHQWSPR